MKTLKYMALIALVFCGKSMFARTDVVSVNFEQIKKELKTAPIERLKHINHELKNYKDYLFRQQQLTDNTIVDVVSQTCARRHKAMGDLKEQLSAHSAAYDEEQSEIQKVTSNKQDMSVVPAMDTQENPAKRR
jgi:hypothetical protein